MLATVYTADLCALTGKVRIENEAALAEYAESVFATYPHAYSVRVEDESGLRCIFRDGRASEQIAVFA